jgi:hypothetical protein
MKDFKPPPVSRKERKLRKMVKQILQWGWPDEDIKTLIEAARKIEVRRMGEVFERVFGSKKNIENN